jgi:deoxyribose-phosphate aldolase
MLTTLDEGGVLPALSLAELGDGLLRPAAVDAVGLESRAALFASRSIKTTAKAAALNLTIAVIDLTTLEGADTPGKVESLCRKAIAPDPEYPDTPHCAAVCVYPQLVATAAAACSGTGVKVASVAGAFPSGLSSSEVRLSDISDAVAAGADEIDIVLNRSAFLCGRYGQVFDDIERSKAACGPAHLKVILETGELRTYERVRTASMLAMAAGADFIKTSTGKISPAATLPVGLCMAEAIRDVADRTGRAVGLKIAGGVRTAKDGWRYAVMMAETLGQPWLTPDLFRIGASSLLNDVLLQRRKMVTGRYEDPDRLSVE